MVPAGSPSASAGMPSAGVGRAVHGHAVNGVLPHTERAAGPTACWSRGSAMGLSSTAIASIRVLRRATSTLVGTRRHHRPRHRTGRHLAVPARRCGKHERRAAHPWWWLRRQQRRRGGGHRVCGGSTSSGTATGAAATARAASVAGGLVTRRGESRVRGGIQPRPAAAAADAARRHNPQAAPPRPRPSASGWRRATAGGGGRRFGRHRRGHRLAPAVGTASAGGSGGRPAPARRRALVWTGWLVRLLARPPPPLRRGQWRPRGPCRGPVDRGRLVLDG